MGVRNPVSAMVGSEVATVPALLASRAEATPEKTFLLWEDRGWTYREAWLESLRFAGWLSQGRTPRGRLRVASYLANCPEAVWTWFGSLAAGAIYVPLNRHHRGPILADMLARARPDVLVTDREGRDIVRSASPTANTEVLLVEDFLREEKSGAERVRWPPLAAAASSVRPGDLAEVMYTSGTTGRSKAVHLSHNQLCRGAGWVVWSLCLRDDDVFHAWLPLFHIAGQVDSVLPMVICGGSVALQRTFSRSRFFDQVRASSATIFIGFSNVVELLLSLPEPETRGQRLRAGVVGAVAAQLRERFEGRFGVVLHDVYGMTEAEPMILPSPGEPCPLGSCGRPSPDFEVAILDPDGERMRTGEVGEICVRPRRPNVLTPGYEGDPEATVQATSGLWFHSGDLGRIDDDGFYYFVDRLKHSIRHRGENISSWELENTVLQHPLVRECCAVAVPSQFGDDDVKIVVAPSDGADLNPAELRDWCRGQMAKFMVPRYIDVVERLPRAPTGKVLKEELRTNTARTWDGERPSAALGASG